MDNNNIDVCECEDDACQICNPEITEDEDEFCTDDCECCKMKVNYTFFD